MTNNNIDMKIKRYSKRLKNTLIITFIALLLLPVIATGILFLAVVSDKDYVRFDITKLQNSACDVTFTDAWGNKINVAPTFNKRVGVDFKNLNGYTIDAFICTEDKRFFRHNGVDLVRVVKSLAKDILSGSFVEGASTITQQLVKNVFLTNKKSVKRKVNEVLLALNQILEAYLNTVYFGGDAYGLQNASRYYYGVEATELTLAQSAGLAGLLKAPNNYSPYVNFDSFNQRKDLVLSLMLKCEKITQNQYYDAQAEIISIGGIEGVSGQQNYIFAALNEAAELLNTSVFNLYGKNCKIETYYNADTQKALTDAIDLDFTKTIKGANSDKCGIVLNNKTHGIEAYYGKSFGNLLNRMINAGSALKPLGVYAPALDIGAISTVTPVLDEPTNFGGGFKPSNYRDNYLGWTTVRKAVEQSLNVPAVKTLNAIGTSRCAYYLNKNGFSIDKNKANLTLALGNIEGGCSFFQLLDGYATLSNGGMYAKSGFVRAIYLDDKLIYSRHIIPKGVFSESTAFLMTDMLIDVTNNGTAKTLKNFDYQIAGKTGTVGQRKGDNTDAIFCGYTTEHTFLFWLGCDTTDAFDSNITGGNQPVKIAKNFLDNFYSTSPQNFEQPISVKKIRLDRVLLNENQQIAVANVNIGENEIIEDYFAVSYIPKEISARKKDNLINKPISLDAEYDNRLIILRSNYSNSKIYKLTQNSKKLLAVDKSAIDKDINLGGVNNYYAEIIIKGQKHTSKTVSVYVEKIQKNNDIEVPKQPEQQKNIQ